MYLSKLYIKNFRNFKLKRLSFSKKITVIVGENASGKTNILEAIHLLSTGKSTRARLEEEMINYREEVGRVRGEVAGIKGKLVVEVVLTRGEIRVGTTKHKKVARKRLLINGVGKRLIDFAGNLNITFFGPHDLAIVTESPSLRRKFLDAALSVVDKEYRRAVLSYEKGLKQRNRLLYRIREEGLSRSQLLFWDRLLIKNGDYVSKKREEFIQYVNSTPPLENHDFKLDYDKSAISEARIEQYAYEEVAAATTLVGPHRDDIVFRIKKPGEKSYKDLGKYGSRGEQRMVVLWLKLSELGYAEEKTGRRSTLLLDDIFSELDHKHREIVMDISKMQQTIITTADPHFVKGVKKIKRIDL
jgi:DNA replication and repair protein RecF